MCPWESSGAIKSYPWRDEPPGNSLERARFNTIRWRSTNSAGRSLVSNISFEQSTSDWPGRTMMIVKTIRLYRGAWLVDCHQRAPMQRSLCYESIGDLTDNAAACGTRVKQWWQGAAAR